LLKFWSGYGIRVVEVTDMQHTRIIEQVPLPYTIEAHEHLLGKPAIRMGNNLYVWIFDSGANTHITVVLDVRGNVVEKTILKVDDPAFLTREVAALIDAKAGTCAA
jgi:hypothetical protein